MNPISTVKNPGLLSRNEMLAVETSFLIDKSNFPAALVVQRGALLGKQANGKYRPYFESVVKTGGAFSTTANTFTLDTTQQVGQLPIAVGDVIESTSGAALGTVATYNAATGVGTLAANSATALAAGQGVRIALSQLALSAAQGKVLKDEAYVDPTQSNDVLAVGYFSGYFVQANTTITAAALAAMSGQTIDSGEARLI